MKDDFVKIAYVGLRQEDGSYMLNVPIYINLKDVDSEVFNKHREELIHRIANIMIHHYEWQLAAYINKKKNGN